MQTLIQKFEASLNQQKKDRQDRNNQNYNQTVRKPYQNQVNYNNQAKPKFSNPTPTQQPYSNVNPNNQYY